MFLLFVVVSNSFFNFKDRANNLKLGQKEIYPNNYEYDTRNTDNKQQQSQLEDPLQQVEQLASFLESIQARRQYLSQFPSLTRPENEGISVEGKNQLSKYKHFRPPQIIPAEVESEPVQNVDPLQRIVFLPKRYDFGQDSYGKPVLDSLSDSEDETYGVDGVEQKNVQDDAIIPIEDNKEGNLKLDLSMVWAMKKALQHEKMTNRPAIDEKVLESGMIEQPKRRREAMASYGAPKVSKLIRSNDNHYYAHPAQYHQAFDSNYKSTKLSFLGSISDFYFIGNVYYFHII